MKLSYETILFNIETYNRAKEILPIISQYENGEVTQQSMRSVNLLQFAEFYDFLKSCKESNFEPIMPDMTWRKLKPILIEKTDNPRLKKFMSNRTQNQFIQLLNNNETYDRLLNGRWLRKPQMTRRGRISSGRRSDERVSALETSILPIINFVIQNDLEVFDSYKSGYTDIKSFVFQERYTHIIRWFKNTKLNIDNIPLREIEVTGKLIESFINILDNLNLDPRKLNLEYVTNTISERLKKSMDVPNGTNVRCLRDIYDNTNRKIFTKDNTYSVQGSYVSNGSILIYLTNDFGSRNYTKYVDFEDMSIHRDNLLNNLFG